MISVLILTKNEQQDLPGCLRSVAWSDDIHVYDSMSTDATVDIATTFGAKVTRRPFDNWAAHQNWGLAHVPFKHPWVFYIDADERMTPELVATAKAAVAAPGDHVAFRVQRRDFLLGRWLKHVQKSPFYLRLFRQQKMRYERLVNPVSIADGPVGQVGGYLDHYPFSKGLAHWIERHNSYSTLEARQIADNRAKRAESAKGADFSVVKAFTERDLSREALPPKGVVLPAAAAPLVKFLILWLGKRGFLDGRAGLTYAALQSIYEYFIVLKTRELAAPAEKPAE